MFARSSVTAAAPRLALLTAVVASVFSTPSFAATVGATELAAVVVTASRQAQRADELLADVSTIESADIERAGPTATVAELLARQPGIEITSRGGPGTASGVMLRGANSQHTLVLVDGIRVASATLADVSWGYLPLGQIERIEILRGPASSLYGADAIGGVIQIFTKRGEGPLRAFADAGVGSWNSRAVNAGVRGGENGWHYHLQAGDQRSDSFSAINNPKNSSYNPDKDGYASSNASANVSYEPAAGHEIGINSFNSDGWNRYDSSPKASDWKQKQTVSGLSLFARNRLGDNWQSTVRLGRGTDNSRQYQDGNFSSAIRTDQDQLQWQNDFSLPLGSGLFALERLEQKVSGSTAYNVSQRTINSVLGGWTANWQQHRWQINLRRDDNSQFGNKSTGSLAYGYQFLPAWRASAAYGTGFKAPSFNDLYWPGSGNPNLNPERARNREVGLRYEQGHTLASATYYRNKVSDLIDWAPGANGLWAPANVSKAKLSGWTFAYSGQLGAYGVNANLDVQDARDGATDKQLRYRAREHGVLALERDLGPWQWRSELVASGKRYNNVTNTQVLGGYAVINLQGSYRFAPDWSVFARANNVFDRQYQLVGDFAAAGANVFVGVRYQPK